MCGLKITQQRYSCIHMTFPNNECVNANPVHAEKCYIKLVQMRVKGATKSERRLSFSMCGFIYFSCFSCVSYSYFHAVFTFIFIHPFPLCGVALYTFLPSFITADTLTMIHRTTMYSVLLPDDDRNTAEPSTIVMLANNGNFINIYVFLLKVMLIQCYAYYAHLCYYIFVLSSYATPGDPCQKSVTLCECVVTNSHKYPDFMCGSLSVCSPLSDDDDDAVTNDPQFWGRNPKNALRKS